MKSLISWGAIAGLCLLGACTPTPAATAPALVQPYPAAASPTPAPAASTAPTATIVPTITSSPQPTLTSTPRACLKSSGVMELAVLESKRLTRPMNYRVFLPPCYQEEAPRRYPVLYMIHGQSYNADQWDRLGMDDTAARLISAGELPSFLIVMPEDVRWTEPDDDPFGRVFMEELLPLIDDTYRTLPNPRFRAIGGLSRGAAWAVHLGILHPDVFGAIGAHSLPVFWTDTNNLRRWLADIPPNQMPRIYLDDGAKDSYLDSAVWFENLLTEMGIPHEWYLFDGYHQEKYWQEHVEGYLRFYAADW